MADAANDPAAPAFTRATVYSDGIETEYLRAGRGRVVVYLGRERHAAVAALAASFRVIVPRVTTALATLAPDGGESPFSRWLRGMLEGLGIVAASFVVEPAAFREVVDFARVNPGVVERLVLLGGHTADGAREMPTLVLRRDGEGEVMAMLRFLAAAERPANA